MDVRLHRLRVAQRSVRRLPLPLPVRKRRDSGRRPEQHRGLLHLSDELAAELVPGRQLLDHGLPAITVPFGKTAEGLPVGIQLVGRPWEEELLLKLAVRLEEARGPLAGPPGY